VVGDRLYIMGTRGDTEFLVAIDVKSGKEVWASRIGPRFTFKGNEWGDGPRATPTVDGSVVFAQGGQGDLVCADAATGKECWHVSLLKDLEGEISPLGGNTWTTGWGFTASPLVDGDQVICVPGGKQGLLAALDKQTSKVKWRSKDLSEPATYSSPLVAEIDGVRQYIELTDQGVAGVAANDGRLLWNYLKKPPYQDVVIPTPVQHDHSVYITAGYGAGCDLVKLTKQGDRFKTEKVYANKNMVNQQGGVVLVDEHIYGYSEGKGWVCQDFKTGKNIWTERRKLGRGSLTYADGHLYCYAEDDGVVALVEASPKGWKENSRFEITQKTKIAKPSGKIWTHPVVANGKLYLRDQDLLFCFDIAKPAGTGK
jgi:outer membrane protein assembly factor BamB